MGSAPRDKTGTELASGRSRAARKAAIQALKLLLAAGLVVHLAIRGDIAWTPLRNSLAQWPYSLPAFLLLALMPLAQFWRWQNLLRASQVHLPHREVFSYLMVSKFFNMAFPGYISGDILRGFYVFRRASTRTQNDPAKKENPQPSSPTVVASIVFDRVTGVIPLFLLCLFGLLVSFWEPLPKPVTAWVSLLAGMGVLVPSGLFVLAYRRPDPPAFLLRLGHWIRLDQTLEALYRGAHHYIRNLALMRSVLSVSFLNQGLAIASFILFGKTLGIAAPLWSYLMLVPLGLLTTAIPISPAGLGIGQLAFLALFRMVGTSQGANLFTLYMASYVLINLGGGLLYVFPSRGQTAPRTGAWAEAHKK